MRVWVIGLKQTTIIKKHVDWFTKHIALAEFFPYHSTDYDKKITTLVEKKGYLPTQQFLF